MSNNDDDGFQIQFQGVAGVAYAIEFTTDFTAGIWELFSGPTPGKAGPMMVTDKIHADQKMRVYRVRVSPLR
jgi:hypothetical protein